MAIRDRLTGQRWREGERPVAGRPVAGRSVRHRGKASFELNLRHTEQQEELTLLERVGESGDGVLAVCVLENLARQGGYPVVLKVR